MIRLSKIRMFFLTLYIVFYMLYPKIYVFNYITLFFIFGYFFSDIKNIKKVKNVIPYLLIIIVFYFLPSLYYNALKSSFFNLIDLFIKISPIIIGLNELQYFNDKNNINDYKKIRNIIICLIIYICIINIIYLQDNPYFARNMANYLYNVPGVSALGVFSGGGYFIVYGFVFLIILLISVVFINKKHNNKIINIFLLLFVVFFIIKANFATAFIMIIISVPVLLYFQNFKRNNILSLIVLICAVGLILNYKDIAKEITNWLPNDSIITIRINEAIENDSDSSASERLYMMQRSFNVIENSFLVGISAEYNHDYNKIANYAGLHTEWVDFFARYGIVLAAMYYVFIYKSFKKIIRSNLFDKKLYMSLFITLVLLGFLNPIMNTGAYLIIFIIIPILNKGGDNEKNI